MKQLTNTVIIVHRDRPQHLEACLNALMVAQEKLEDPQQTDVIIVECSKIPPQHSFPYSNISFPQPGMLNKAKAINFAVSNLTTDLITLLDVDTVMQDQFFEEINTFFSIAENKDTRLGHRVRMVDKTYSEKVVRHGLTVFDNLVAPRPDRSPAALEDYKGIPTGNSHVTMLRANFIALGGYDERFCGYGLEDMDFNCRAAKKYPLHILPDNDTYHLWHPTRTPFWNDEAAEHQNRQLFIQHEKEGWPDIEWQYAPKVVVTTCCKRSKHWQTAGEGFGNVYEGK